MRTIPKVATLQEAVETVIASNTKDKYPPTRFRAVVEGKSGDELRQVCERLILKGEILSDLEKALGKRPMLLFLEDLVARQGKEWHISDEAIEAAKARTIWFDRLVGETRYIDG